MTFDVPLDDGTFKRVRVDTLAQEADGSLVGVESKFGPSAKFTSNQQVAYPVLLDNGVVPRGAKAEQAIQRGADLDLNNLNTGFPIRVDHWLTEGQ